MTDELTDADLDAMGRVAVCGGAWWRYEADVPRLVAALRSERTETKKLREALKDLYDLAHAYLTPERLEEERDSLDAAFVALTVNDRSLQP